MHDHGDNLSAERGADAELAWRLKDATGVLYELPVGTHSGP